MATKLMKVPEPLYRSAMELAEERGISAGAALQVLLERSLQGARADEVTMNGQNSQTQGNPQAQGGLQPYAPGVAPLATQAPLQGQPLDQGVSIFVRGMEFGQKIKVQDERITDLERRQDAIETRTGVLEEILGAFSVSHIDHLNAHQQALESGSPVQVQSTINTLQEALAKISDKFKGDPKAVMASVEPVPPKALEAPVAPKVLEAPKEDSSPKQKEGAA